MTTTNRHVYIYTHFFVSVKVYPGSSTKAQGRSLASPLPSHTSAPTHSRRLLAQSSCAPELRLRPLTWGSTPPPSIKNHTPSIILCSPKQSYIIHLSIGSFPLAFTHSSLCAIWLKKKKVDRVDLVWRRGEKNS